MTCFGHKTVQEGEKAIVTNFHGKTHVVTGPARVKLWRSRLTLLRPFYASEVQYLEINYKAGPRENRPGPLQVFLNPIEHDSIYVRDSVLISANEALVVYGADPSNPKGESFTRKVLHGPKRYTPKPTEWIHTFNWHGEDPNNKTRKIKNALTFKKLRVIADQFYYNVHDVRTSDDTQITVKLMIFFELKDIERMLDSTHDPIADFINAACSDVIQYCSSITYEEFVENTSAMNELSTFKQLRARAETIGYQINKAVFRGFHSSDALQSMHDKAIYERTRLRLEAETEEHKQKTLDLQLQKEEERAARKRELQREKEEHERLLAREKHAEKLGIQTENEEHKQKTLDLQATKEKERLKEVLSRQKEQDEHRRQLQHEAHKDTLREQKELEELNLSQQKASMELEKMKVAIEQERLQALKSYGVDVTRVLIAEARGEADKTIRVENESNTALHLHEQIQPGTDPQKRYAFSSVQD